MFKNFYSVTLVVIVSPVKICHGEGDCQSPAEVILIVIFGGERKGERKGE
jgi:hypothetical protein